MSTKPIEEELIQKFQESLNVLVSTRLGNSLNGEEELVQRFYRTTYRPQK